MKINPGNARGLLVPQGDRPFSFVVYSSEIRDFGLHINIIRQLFIRIYAAIEAGKFVSRHFLYSRKENISRGIFLNGPRPDILKRVFLRCLSLTRHAAGRSTAAGRCGLRKIPPVTVPRALRPMLEGNQRINILILAINKPIYRQVPL